MGKVQSDKTKVINFTHSMGNLAVGNPKEI
jgi:hypothetical protein